MIETVELAVSLRVHRAAVSQVTIVGLLVELAAVVKDTIGIALVIS